MGWTPASYDAQGALVNLLATRDPAEGLGAYNVAGYSNPVLDTLIRRIRIETDAKARLGLLRQALKLVKDEAVYIPLHRQDVVWAARQNIDLVQRADDIFSLRFVRVK
jgi:peptide/nickel transport system substrate-binding protein